MPLNSSLILFWNIPPAGASLNSSLIYWYCQMDKKKLLDIMTLHLALDSDSLSSHELM